MTRRERLTGVTHFHQIRSYPKLGCGQPAYAPGDPANWGSDLVVDTATVWSKVNCADCLEFLYGRKKQELENIAQKIDVIRFQKRRA